MTWIWYSGSRNRFRFWCKVRYGWGVRRTIAPPINVCAKFILEIANMAALLRLDRVTAGFGQTVIVEDISFTLGQGEVLAVLGRNGVGKSTLMKTIAGQTRLHAGNIEFRERKIRSLASSSRARAGSGHVPQTREIFRSLTFEEHLLIAVEYGQWNLERVYDLFP